jgi:membrane associated rhomboid family serine protease
MSPAARMYWLAVALQHHGDVEGSRAAFERARSKSRGRPRELIDEALARLPATEKITPSPTAAEVIERVESAPLPAPIHLPRPHGPWATWSLTAAILIAAALTAWLAGSSSDPGVLLRVGAMVRGRIEDGEWWRLVSCLFVHVGSVHLVVNAIGIYFLGKVCEELFGTSRTFVIFGVAGIAGAIASCLASTGVSAGASGAIFGVLGAVFIELTLHRAKYRAAWTRGMWSRLVVVIVAQAAIGFIYPVIDQWAHGFGLVAGVVVGAALSPSARWAKLGLYAGRGLAVAFGGVVMVAAVMVATTSIADSLGGPERVRHELREVAVTAPAGWVQATPTELVDRDNLVILRTGRKPLQAPADASALVAEWTAETARDARARGLTLVDLPAGRIATPAGWEGVERIGTLDDPMGHTQRWRVIAASKDIGGEMIRVLLFVPDSIALAAPALFSDIIGSAGPR